MQRNMTGWVLGACVVLLACGRPQRTFDGGFEDAGTDASVDAGRPKGDDPPAGYSLALELPGNAALTTRLGVATSMVLDQNQQPMLAVLSVDPNGDGSREDDQLLFTRWDGVEKAWSPPQQIAVVGPVDISEPNRPVSLTRDAVTGAIGIAFVAQNDHAIRLATSADDGETWSLDIASDSNAGADALTSPVLAMNGAEMHLAYHQANVGCSFAGCGAVKYRKRTGSNPFAAATSPAVQGAGTARAASVALALDSAGTPGVAFMYGNEDGSDVRPMYWRPGEAQATAIMPSNLAVNAWATPELRNSVALAYADLVPHVAFHLRTSQADGLLWYTTMPSGSQTFSAPLAVPRNGGVGMLDETRWYQAISVDAQGNIAIAAQFAKTTGQPQMCGGPKLTRGSLTNGWVTCAPDNQRKFGYAGASVNLARRTSGRLVLAFPYENRANPSLNNKAGVVLWWEP
ncbi:MAG: hypothetical protein K1X64_08975 [Myxococcaceae bacterium]|nr:hypothetical protein [Myxococcaceae bacterium]